MGNFVKDWRSTDGSGNPFKTSTNVVVGADGIGIHHGRLVKYDVAGTGIMEMASATDIQFWLGVMNGNYPESPNVIGLVPGSSGLVTPSIMNAGVFQFLSTVGESYSPFDSLMMGADANTVMKAIVPAAPTLTQPTVAGATVPAGAYTIGLTWYGLGWETTLGATAAITIIGGNDLVVTIPAFPAALTGGASPIYGAKIYATKAGGTHTYYLGDVDTSGGAATFHLAADLSIPQSLAVLPPQIHGLSVGNIAPEAMVSFPITGGGFVDVVLNESINSPYRAGY